MLCDKQRDSFKGFSFKVSNTIGKIIFLYDITCTRIYIISKNLEVSELKVLSVFSRRHFSRGTLGFQGGPGVGGVAVRRLVNLPQAQSTVPVHPYGFSCL